MNKISNSHEDYLEAMVMLGASTKQSVRPVDVASKMGVSKASVNKAISVLREKGYLNQPYYGDITLTQKGEDYGRKVLERHKVLTAFLHDVLGIDAKTAEEEACMMEHAISDESFEKWMDYVYKICPAGKLASVE